MGRPVKTVLVGLGGFGNFHLDAILKEGEQNDLRLIAGVDPSPERCQYLAELKRRGVAIHTDLKACLDAETPELAIISSPIHQHCPQTCLALSRGLHVICEKPAAATIQEVHTMIAARDAALKTVGVGFQWCWTPAVQALKKDILAGLYGKPKRLRSLIFGPRDEVYYNRNDWAGRIKDAAGRWILDSPVNNAYAHNIHLMLYLIGKRVDQCADLATVQAELYRAHPIQSFDTAALRMLTTDGIPVLFYVTHAMREDTGQRYGFTLEFEKGTITYNFRKDTNPHADFIGTFADGTTKAYGGLHKEYHLKLWASVRSVQTGAPPLVSLESAGLQVLVTNAAHTSMPVITDFPAKDIVTTGEVGKRERTVNGIEDVLTACHAGGKLPSELGAAWAKAGKVIDVRKLTTFPAQNAQELETKSS